MYPPDGKEEICLKIKERRENILHQKTDMKSRKDFARKKIHYNAEIVPFTSNFDVGKITNPDNVRTFLIEVLM